MTILYNGWYIQFILFRTKMKIKNNKTLYYMMLITVLTKHFAQQTKYLLSKSKGLF